MASDTHPCPRCGCKTTGRVCTDCRDADPEWFALVGLYHRKTNPTGTRARPVRSTA